MITVKCFYENGDTITTGINATLQGAREWFENNVFNIGSVEDNIQKCERIELINRTITTNNGWKLEIKDENNLLNNEIIKELEQLNKTIYWNDSTCKHWIFDFKVNNVWFEAIKVDMCKNYILLNAYN